MPQETSSSAEHKEWLKTELDALFTQTKSPKVDFAAIAGQITDLIISELKAVYGPDSLPADTSRLSQKVEKLLKNLPDHNLRNKRIVELGCGSKNSFDNFKPWFCRFLHVLGANPVGIDIGINIGEPFENYLQDLTRENCLHMLKSDSADVVLTDAFFDSPTLQKIQSEKRINREDIRRNLFPQIQRILKPEGIYMNQTSWSKALCDQYAAYSKADLNFDKWIQAEIAKYRTAATDPSKTAWAINNLTDLALDQFFHHNKDSVHDPVKTWRKLIHVIGPIIEHLPDHDISGKKVLYILETTSSPDSEIAVSPDKDPMTFALKILNADVVSIHGSAPPPPESSFDIIAVNHASCSASASQTLLAYAKNHLTPNGLLIEITPNGHYYSDNVKKRAEL